MILCFCILLTFSFLYINKLNQLNYVIISLQRMKANPNFGDIIYYMRLLELHYYIYFDTGQANNNYI